MGYSIYIGELRIGKQVDEQTAKIHYILYVEPRKNDDAPAFGDVLSDYKNEIHSSNVAWKQTLKAVGLGSWIERLGLMLGADGVPKPITEKLVSEVNNAFNIYTSENPTLIPRFGSIEGEQYLARLMWLKYWVSWAYENCANPTFYWD